ncbi:MAG: Pyrrolo-quinoline quinone repeat-containing protein [Acidimicrobiales bacterium]|nr:Pyrrolo-quinoline quinone repeat-containing protein [Acidimicrobiales bacterium]
MRRTQPRRRRLLALVPLVALVAIPGIRATRAAAPTPSPVAGCGPVGVTGGDWPSYGHDLSNTRNQDHERAIAVADVPTLAPAWTFSSNGAGGSGDFTGTPSVADGCVFAGSNGGWVYAINADTGKLVWKTKAPSGGLINASVAVEAGTVYAAVSKTTRSGCTANCGGPYVIALDEGTGALKWTSAPIDVQPGADVYGSPVVFDGLVFEGVSGGAAELGDQTDRYDFQGSFVLLDAPSGALVKKTWTIHSPDVHDNFAGAGIWSTPAVDSTTKYAYVGTGNPFKPQDEAPHADSIVKIDLDRTRPTFGEIVGSYKGNVDEYVDQSTLPCVDFMGNNPATYPQGLGSCSDQDLDFGAAPNLFTDAGGRKLVGAGQKSGVYHVADAATMAPVWKTPVGPPSAVGGIVGSTAVDSNGVYGPVTTGGYLWSLDRTGGPRWATPTADGVHWGNPVAVGNGIVYTVDLKGFLGAYDGRLGTPLLHRPIAAGSGTGSSAVASWGGVSIARNTVYAAVGISGLPDGFIVAFKPGGGQAGGVPQPPPLPPTPGAPSAGNTVIAGPGAVATTYATPAVTIQHGQSLSFTNLDVPQHDVQGNNGSFGSPLISTGQSTPVAGVQSLPPGSYAFYCSLHRNMTGTLIVN